MSQDEESAMKPLPRWGQIALGSLSVRHTLQLTCWGVLDGQQCKPSFTTLGKKWDLLSGFCRVHRIWEGKRAKPRGRVRNHVPWHRVILSLMLLWPNSTIPGAGPCTLAAPGAWCPSENCRPCPRKEPPRCTCAPPSGQSGYCSFPFPEPAPFCQTREWFLRYRTRVSCWQPDNQQGWGSQTLTCSDSLHTLQGRSALKVGVSDIRGVHRSQVTKKKIFAYPGARILNGIINWCLINSNIYI